MIFDFLRAPKKGSPAAQITEMEAALARLQAELKEAEAIVEERPTKRAAMLTSAASNADIKALDDRSDDAILTIERLEAAETELISRLERLRNGAERERIAADCERSAAQIESSVAALESAAAIFATAMKRTYNELLTAIPQETGLQKAVAFNPYVDATPEDFTRSIMAAAIYAITPELFETQPTKRNAAGPAVAEKSLNVSICENGVITRYLPGLFGEDCVIPSPRGLASHLIAPLREKAKALRHSEVNVNQ